MKRPVNNQRAASRCSGMFSRSERCGSGDAIYQTLQTKTTFRLSNRWNGGYHMKNNAMAMGVKTRIIYSVLAIMTIILSIGENTMAQTKPTTLVKNIVLVHGGFVDGSGWQRVYNTLKKDGYTVTIVQNPTISLADAGAVTKRAIAPP